MQPQGYPVQHERVLQIWRTFMERARLTSDEEAFLDPAVLQSWRRCLPRLDATSRPHPKSLKPTSLASVLRAQDNLIALASPVMEDIHQFVEGSNCAIVLADGSACILEVQGDPAAMEMVERLGLGQGSYWSEGQLGTNALGIVRVNAMPVQVVGAEHYFRVHHRYATTAAPIHDVRGRIIGLIGIAGLAENASSHTLGLVMTAARAIANQLQTDWYVEEANRHLTEVRTVLGSITEGIVSWNEIDVINHVNGPAGNILNIRPSLAVGRRIDEVLSLPGALVEAIGERCELRDVEMSFSMHDQSSLSLVNLRPVYEGHRYIGCILMLRPIEHVRRLVHQQIGVEATLSLDDIASSSQSPAMHRVLRQARIAARGTAPVLLRGEGGVGKNHIARAIHNDGVRRNAPFISINCQAIPHELMISELMGHDEGSDSRSRPSKFELASGGAILLDQIEHLSLEMQAVVLQLIETGHVLRLGSPRPIPVEVRIIAATTANLEERVRDGSFISHLYYRFGVFNITIPPLRERSEDIPLLAERFLARITRTHGRAAWIDDEALSVLCQYPWPGNVRELESILERAVSHSTDGVIRRQDLPQMILSGRVITGNGPQPQPVMTIAEVEREAILRAAFACNGQVTAMAHHLGIGRTTLWRKLKHYDIDTSRFKA